MSEGAAPLLTVDDVSLEFRTRSGTVRALQHVGLAVGRGEIVGLVGGLADLLADDALLAFDLVAVVGGKVHTLVPGSKPAEMTVLIDDDRIRAVGADVAIPAGAKRIDAHGLHIVPGLIDGFGYHDPEHDPLYLAAGIAVLRVAPVCARIRTLPSEDSANAVLAVSTIM